MTAVDHAKLSGARLVVVKIGSTLLVDDHSGRMRRAWLDALADDLAVLRHEGVEIIVVSSGAIAVGRHHLDLKRKAIRLEEQQAAAATGQIRLAHAYQSRPPRPPARSAWPTPIRRPWRGTTSPWLRSCSP
jgi:glutamate 5-kinase